MTIMANQDLADIVLLLGFLLEQKGLTPKRQEALDRLRQRVVEQAAEVPNR